MSRYTVKELRAFVETMNERYPLPEPNGYGNNNRFVVTCAYGGYSVDSLAPNSTGHAHCGCYGHDTAREAHRLFAAWLVDAVYYGWLD